MLFFLLVLKKTFENNNEGYGIHSFLFLMFLVDALFDIHLMQHLNDEYNL
jgi:hypothetical protein